MFYNFEKFWPFRENFKISTKILMKCVPKFPIVFHTGSGQNFDHFIKTVFYVWSNPILKLSGLIGVGCIFFLNLGQVWVGSGRFMVTHYHTIGVQLLCIFSKPRTSLGWFMSGWLMLGLIRVKFGKKMTHYHMYLACLTTTTELLLLSREKRKKNEG